jgi:hypothetical protein
MAVILEMDESNGATETVTPNVLTLVAGSVDAASFDPATYPLTPGANSYEKWIRIHVTDLGGAAAVTGFKVWASAPPAGTSVYYNGSTDQATYNAANHKQVSYSPPVTAATRTPEPMPTSEPASANLGIGGSLTGQLIAPGWTDYQLIQVRTTGSATVGATLTVHLGYTPVQ